MLYIDLIEKKICGTAKAWEIKKFGLIEASQRQIIDKVI